MSQTKRCDYCDSPIHDGADGFTLIYTLTPKSKPRRTHRSTEFGSKDFESTDCLLGWALDNLKEDRYEMA